MAKAGAVVVDVGMLYSAHGQWLCNWLRRHTRCHERAVDLTHDAFCRVIERCRNEVPLDPRAFLATVARRLLVDDIRSREVERAYIDVLALHHTASDTVTPERIAMAVQLLSGIVRLLSDLPEPAYQAFLLRRLDGLTHSQIAARLGVSDRTVKRYIATAYEHCYAYAFLDE